MIKFQIIKVLIIGWFKVLKLKKKQNNKMKNKNKNNKNTHHNLHKFMKKKKTILKPN